MSRCFALCVALCLASVSLAQTGEQQSSSKYVRSSSPVQVFYIVDINSITTYNVNPQTLSATQVGKLAVNNSSTWNYSLTPSPNDHFLYFASPDANSQWHLFVYPTDAFGAPHAPATQELRVNGSLGLQFDPNANFAYAVFRSPFNFGNDAYYIRRYLTNPTTGRISQPQPQAKYVLPNGAGGTTYCGLGFAGFNPSATKLYDEVLCSSHGGDSATYYERTLDRATGMLGPDVRIYSWANFSGGGEWVQFAGNHMFDFVTPTSWQLGQNQVNIYPVLPDTHSPLLQCTAKMLNACGYAGGLVHPSGEYLFMRLSSTMTQIDKVDLSHKRIIDAGSSTPDEVQQFSPDGTLIYGVIYGSSGYTLNIYGFNVSTAEVTKGDSIFVPGLDSFFVAERY